MKRTTVKSTMSNRVVRMRLGISSSAGSVDTGGPKEIQGLYQLDSNERTWAERRAQFHATTGQTAMAALASNEPDDARDNGDLAGLLDEDGSIHVQIPPASTRFSRLYRHPYARYVEPAVPFRRYDPRSWRDRIQAREDVWAGIMPKIADVYLAWRDSQVTEPVAAAPEDPNYFEVDVVREYQFVRRFRVAQGVEEHPAVALARAGLLPCVPLEPSIAVSVDLLDFYYRLRRHAPRLGIQQFVKALCDTHDRPYQRYLRDQFELAFDVFLALRREIDGRVKILLNRAAPHWRVKNSCPPCRYKLENEPDLLIPAFIAMDGNNSMKRSAAAGLADPRKYTSDYKIDDEYIAMYANEVKTRTRVSDIEKGIDDGARVVVVNEPGEPGDDAPPTPCTLRWKASKAEQQKIAPDMFDQTGFYPAVCRHGLVMWYCEMRKSGELAKYPLAMLARVMEAGLTPLTAGADIGCALQGTLSRSSLGERAGREGLRVRMNAFHGYGHNRLCQVKEHPLYIDGFGLEELETCERFFSLSNSVAGGVRHATHFHYSQFLDLFLYAWDEDKYAALSTFLCDNVKQAQQIITTFEPTLNEFKSARGLTDAVIEGWRMEERQHLESLKEEPAEDVLAMDYVQALRELAQTQKAAEESRVALQGGFIVSTPQDMSNASRSDVAKQATKARRAHAAYIASLANVEALERALNVVIQWHPDSLDYRAALEKIRLREYMRAVDRLELLMLQRMFELAKTHAFGTGYKMREAIGKNIKARSKAIATAVRNYNEAAQALDPPAPPVDFTKLMEWTELQEFDLLRLSRRGDVRTRAWAQPANREAATKHHKIKRAREELVRCQVEIRRLVTAIHDEEAEFVQVLTTLRQQGHPLTAEVERMSQRRVATNALHMERFAPLAKAPGLAAFVNSCLVSGVREGGTSPPAADPSMGHTPRLSSAAENDAEEEDSGNELDDEQAEQILAVQDFIGQLES